MEKHKKDIKVENVIVDNGFTKHKVQYVHSPIEILNLVTRALTFVGDDVKKDINTKQLTVLIKTDSNYNIPKSKTIIDADNELLFRFNGVN